MKADDFDVLVTLELIRIRCQVQQYLLHTVPVRAHLRRDITVHLHDDFVPTSFRLNLENCEYLHYSVFDVEELEFRREIAVFEELTVKEVIHEEAD